jgi:hypothetical protein
MTTPYEYLINGSIVRSGYESFNQPMSALLGGVNHPVIGILFLLFQFLLFIANRNITVNFWVSLIVGLVIFPYLYPAFFWIQLIIWVLEIGGIGYAWFKS